MKEDPKWMRITVEVAQRTIWAIVGFFAPIVCLGVVARTAMFAMRQESWTVQLVICLVGAILGALLGPLLYVPGFQKGTGKLEEIKRMSGPRGRRPNAG